MAETPTRASHQPKTDEGMEISPDGGIITQMAAPTHAPRVAPKPATMADAPTVDESENETQVDEQTPPTPTDEQSPVTEETPAVEQEKVTDFTEFLKIKDTGEPTDEIQKQKAKETPEGEVQKPAETQDKTQQVTKATLKQKVEQDLKSRDLTGLPEELVPHFQKDMSRAAFDKVKPIVLEHKTLKEKTAAQEQELERLRKGAIPDSYYDNPYGFVLDPEYQQAENLTSQAQAILAHWQDQYKKVRDGATEFNVLGYNQHGQLAITGKQPADKDAEMNILQIVNNAQQQVFKVAGKAEAIKETFKGRHTNALGWLNNYESKAFAHFDTEQGKQFTPQLKSIMDEFPPEFKNHPLAKTLAKSIATNVHLATLITQNSGKVGGVIQQQGTQTTTAPNGKPASVVKQQRRAGPTVADVGADTGGGEKGKGNEVSMDDFNRVKESE